MDWEGKGGKQAGPAHSDRLLPLYYPTRAGYIEKRCFQGRRERMREGCGTTVRRMAGCCSWAYSPTLARRFGMTTPWLSFVPNKAEVRSTARHASSSTDGMLRVRDSGPERRSPGWCY
jgi:hypothetical protein